MADEVLRHLALLLGVQPGADVMLEHGGDAMGLVELIEIQADFRVGPRPD